MIRFIVFFVGFIPYFCVVFAFSLFYLLFSAIYLKACKGTLFFLYTQIFFVFSSTPVLHAAPLCRQPPQYSVFRPRCVRVRRE